MNVTTKGTTHRIAAAFLAAGLLFAAACTSTRRDRPVVGASGADGEAGDSGAQRSFTILGINDFYNIEGADGGASGGMARLRALRRQLEQEAPDLLLLHAGDLLSPSLLSRHFKGAQMVDLLNLLDGDDAAFDSRLIVTFGNHEFDRSKLKYAAQLDQRIDQSEFRWLKTNIDFGHDEDGRELIDGDNLLDTILVDSGGVRVGVFGLTIDSQQAEYIDRFRSPLEVARRATRELRQRGAEVVVALTHLRVSDDQELLAALGDDGPDLIIGGHEHQRLSRSVDGRLVIKADADVRSASVVRVTLDDSGPPRVDFRYQQLGPEGPPPDPQVAARVEGWFARFDVEFCSEQTPAESPGCVDKVLGLAADRLVAEELDIRRYETNFGNWLADQALAALADHGAQIAILNSGGLRLNQNLPAGTEITRRHLEAMFPYSTRLQLLRVSGAVLQQVLRNSVSDWVGNGHFLQIAGLAYRHDQQGEVDRLTLLTPDGPRAIAPEEELLLVTVDFLVNPNGDQDGYTMLKPDLKVDTGDSVDLELWVIDALKAAGPAGIAPRLEGRICIDGSEDICLAQP